MTCKIEAAIAEVEKRGWRIRGIGEDPPGLVMRSSEPWFCWVYPGHLGEYIGQTPIEGSTTLIRMQMPSTVASGATAVEAILATLPLIDASRASEIYLRLEKALKAWRHERQGDSS